jgi:aspartate/methionine/tyrosine aminotransferase
MNIAPFLLERWQSLHEHDVDINLSDSGAHPLTVHELLGKEGVAALGEIRLGYTQTNGTAPLRAAIAAMHPGATKANVLVTTGGIEANFLSIWNLVRPGDEVIWMQPNYGQIGNLVESLGGVVRPWVLRPDFEAGEWVADLDELRSLITPRTRLIAVCHPNNPTGATFGADWLQDVSAVAAQAGAWVLSDEIYIGAELGGEARTPSAWGRHTQTLVTGSLSKAWGLPGLRLGWVVGPTRMIDALWKHHDYTTIAPGALSDALALHALTEPVSSQLTARARAHLRGNLVLCESWAEGHRQQLQWVRPQAGAMFWTKLVQPQDTELLVRRLREEHSVLLVPGEHYAQPGWLRIGFGGEAHELEAGLAALSKMLG